MYILCCTNPRRLNPLHMNINTLASKAAQALFRQWLYAFVRSQPTARTSLVAVCPVLDYLLIFHTYNEEACTDHHCLDFHVKIYWDLDPKVGSVGEDIVNKSRPVLGNFANRRHFIEGFYLHQFKNKIK